MVQKPLQCCSNKPDFQITYSVSGSEKDYLVCLLCFQKEYFSKHIVRKLPIKIINFQNEQSEVNDENTELVDEHDERPSQTEHDSEQGEKN